MNEFNGIQDAIKNMAKRIKIPLFFISENAPNTFDEMIRSYKETNSLIISSQGCENTIYGDKEINYLFRAMHDLAHISLMADFSLQGEGRVAKYQMAQVGTELAKIIRIEVIEQANFFIENGKFPLNQKDFTLNILKRM